jgi:hypothetical protein
MRVSIILSKYILFPDKNSSITSTGDSQVISPLMMTLTVPVKIE